MVDNFNDPYVFERIRRESDVLSAESARAKAEKLREEARKGAEEASSEYTGLLNSQEARDVANPKTSKWRRIAGMAVAGALGYAGGGGRHSDGGEAAGRVGRMIAFGNIDGRRDEFGAKVAAADQKRRDAFARLGQTADDVTLANNSELRNVQKLEAFRRMNAEDARTQRAKMAADAKMNTRKTPSSVDAALAAQLDRLQEMLDKGEITPEEFETQAKRVHGIYKPTQDKVSGWRPFTDKSGRVMRINPNTGEVLPFSQDIRGRTPQPPAGAAELARQQNLRVMAEKVFRGKIYPVVAQNPGMSRKEVMKLLGDELARSGWSDRDISVVAGGGMDVMQFIQEGALRQEEEE